MTEIAALIVALAVLVYGGDWFVAEDRGWRWRVGQATYAILVLGDVSAVRNLVDEGPTLGHVFDLVMLTGVLVLLARRRERRRARDAARREEAEAA